MHGSDTPRNHAPDGPPGLPPVPPALRRHVEADGLWREVYSAPAAGALRPALFLDRDGTVIEEVHYISRPEQVRLIDAAARLIRRANALGVAVVVVTNQAGIGRGHLGWEDYAAVEAAVAAALEGAGARIDALYAAPHAPSPAGIMATPYRKPAPGMLLRATRDLGLDLGASWIAGDCATDIEAGRRAGLAGGWLVPTGYGARDAEAAAKLAHAAFEVVIGEDLAAMEARLESLVARTAR